MLLHNANTTGTTEGATSPLALAKEAARRGLSLDLLNLTLAVSGKRVVDGINLTLRDDTFTVIMGPNGAGKSLLLRMLHGLILPSQGMVRWGGQAIDDTIRRRQAMVFQQPVLLRRSVAANVDFAIRLKGRPDTRRRDVLLDRVGLLKQANQPARLLSGGEQQRLALARALATDPDMLFLDEPTASLDPASVLIIEEIVTSEHRRGTKVLFVTHDIGQARRLADEVVFLHRGRLVEHSPADRFFNAPASEQARAYLAGRIVL